MFSSKIRVPVARSTSKRKASSPPDTKKNGVSPSASVAVKANTSVPKTPSATVAVSTDVITGAFSLSAASRIVNSSVSMVSITPSDKVISTS